MFEDFVHPARLTSSEWVAKLDDLECPDASVLISLH